MWKMLIHVSAVHPGPPPVATSCALEDEAGRCPDGEDDRERTIAETVDIDEETFMMAMEEALEGLQAMQHVLHEVSASCLPPCVRTQETSRVQSRVEQAAQRCEQAMMSVEHELAPVLRDIRTLLHQEPSHRSKDEKDKADDAASSPLLAALFLS